MKPSRLFRIVGLAIVLVPVPLLGVGCYQVLGLGDFNNNCGGNLDESCPDAGLCTPGQTADCYTAVDPSTEHKGICHGGTKKCGTDGLYGPCEGEQTPAAQEDCSNDLDDDCDGKVNNGCPCTPGEKKICYDGPKITKNVGDCKTGEAICESDGMTLGECKGEVMPAAEDYNKKGDENCDGIPSADTEWVDVLSALGANATVNMTGAASDDEGNIYVVGFFEGTLQVGSTMLTETGGFLAKADSTGKWLWAKSFPKAVFGVPLFSPGQALVFDSKSNSIVATGETQGVDFGASSGPVPQGVFLVAFDTSGHTKWSGGCSMTGTDEATIGALTVDSSGEFTIGGNLQGSITCGTKTLSAASSASKSALVAHFDKSGSPQWAMSWGDTSTTDPVDQNVYSVATAPDNGVWVTGELRGHPIGDINVLEAADETDVFLVKVKPGGGDYSYAKSFGVTGDQGGAALAIDGTGNVYLTGYNSGKVNFGGQDQSSVEQQDVFVAAFDATGAHLWSADYGGGNDLGIAVGVEPDGTVMVTGAVHGGINFGLGAFVSDSAGYGFLTRLHPQQSGSAPKDVWSKYYGGDTSDQSAEVVVQSMALAPRAKSTQKDVILVGQFAQPADFGTGKVGTSTGGTLAFNGFVVRVAP